MNDSAVLTANENRGLDGTSLARRSRDHDREVVFATCELSFASSEFSPSD